MFTAYTVVSGQSYPIRQIAGKDGLCLDDLDGCARFCVDLDGHEHEVEGEGRVVPDGTVRFFEKAEHGLGKDVRIWTVRAGQHGLTATP